MAGGPSQTDTFDMKPGTAQRRRISADRDQRARHPDLRTLPRVARHMDKLAVAARHVHRRGGPRPRQLSDADRLSPGAGHVSSAHRLDRVRRDWRDRISSCPISFGSAAAPTPTPASWAPGTAWSHIPQIHDERARNLENARAVRRIRSCPSAGPRCWIGWNSVSSSNSTAPDRRRSSRNLCSRPCG